MILLMKIGPYSLIKKGLTKFESIKLLTINKYDPPINEKSAGNLLVGKENYFKKFDCIVCSTLNRSITTLDYLLSRKILKENVKIIKDSNVNEIKFDIKDMCTQREYEKFGSCIVRKRFIEAFINNSLLDSRKEIIEKILIVNKELHYLQNNYRNILCISHTFFIKLFIIYFKNPELLTNPDIIKKYIDPQKRIMDFFETINFFA